MNPLPDVPGLGLLFRLGLVDPMVGMSPLARPVDVLAQFPEMMLDLLLELLFGCTQRLGKGRLLGLGRQGVRRNLEGEGDPIGLDALVALHGDAEELQLVADGLGLSIETTRHPFDVLASGLGIRRGKIMIGNLRLHFPSNSRSIPP